LIEANNRSVYIADWVKSWRRAESNFSNRCN